MGGWGACVRPCVWVGGWLVVAGWCYGNLRKSTEVDGMLRKNSAAVVFLFVLLFWLYSSSELIIKGHYTVCFGFTYKPKGAAAPLCGSKTDQEEK